MKQKKCSKCGQYKPFEDFYKDATAKNGHRCDCKACFHTRRVIFKNKNPEAYRHRVKTYNKTYKNNHPERVRAKKRRDRWNLHTNYVVSILVKSGFDKQFVLANPALIEAKRLLLKINRVITNKKLK